MQGDPFGLAISEYFEGEKKATLRVDSTITQDEKIKVSTLYRTYRGMPELEKTAIDLAKGKILDIGAGSGAHALILQKRKLDITALDLSKGACETMTRRGLNKVVHSDIFQYQEKGFDTMLLLMNGIGIAGTLDGLDKLLVHLRTLLQTGGRIYMDTTDILYMFEEADGSVLIDLHGAYYGELEYEISYKNETSTFPWLYIDYATLETHATALGYSCEMVVADEDGSYLACLEKIEF